MLRSTGMRVTGRPAHETWLCEPDREQPSSHWRWNAAEFFSAVGAAPREGESR
jgi:tRNA (mo5U34)-methyltransferase